VRRRGLAVLGAAGLAVALLTGSAAPWLTAEVSTAISTEVLAVPGSTMVRSVPAAALVLLACALALALAGRLARLAVAVVVTGVGVLVVATTAAFLTDPVPAAAGALAAATGIRGVDVVPELTAWPVVVAVLGGLVAVSGVVVAAASRRWAPGASRRYEANGNEARRASAGSPAVGARATEDWDALTRGEDPS
jgi:hypothetical protein